MKNKIWIFVFIAAAIMMACDDEPKHQSKILLANDNIDLTVGAGITVDQSNAAVEVVKDAFAALAPDVKDALGGKIKTIEIVNATTAFATTTGGYKLSFKFNGAQGEFQTNFENTEKDLGKCTCLPGAVVLEDESGCAKYCETEKVKGARLGNGIPVILDGEVAITATNAVKKIEEVFEYMESSGEQFIPYADYIKNNTKVMRVVSDTLNIVPDIIKEEDGKLVITINDGTLNDEGYLDIIGGEFYSFALNNMPKVSSLP